MAEAKRGKFGKEGEASRFLKVVVEVLKCAFSLFFSFGGFSSRAER